MKVRIMNAMKSCAAVLLSLAAVSTAVAAAKRPPVTWYASSDGSAEASGTRELPLDLLTAVNEKAGPGDSVVLRAGTYRLKGRALRSPPKGFKGDSYLCAARGVRICGAGDGVVLDGADAERGRGLLAAKGVCISNVTFRNFVSEGAGAAVAFTDRTGGACVDCSFENCKSDGSGGAVFSGSLRQCKFLRNRAESLGGAAFQSTKVLNCRFNGNVAGDSGGAVAQCGIVSNCTFAANRAERGKGGAVAAQVYGRRTTVYDSRFDGNDAGTSDEFAKTLGDGIKLVGTNKGIWNPYCFLDNVPSLSSRQQEAADFREDVLFSAGREKRKKSFSGPHCNRLVLHPGDDVGEALERLCVGRDPEKPAEVIFADGVYLVTNTAWIAAGDSNIVIRAEHPGKTVLTGGTVFRGTHAMKVSDKRVLARFKAEVRDRIRMLPLPDEVMKRYAEAPARCSFDAAALTVSVDGRMMKLSRWPNRGYVSLGKNDFKRPSCIGGDAKGKGGHRQSSWFAVKDKSPSGWDYTDNSVYTEGFGHCGWFSEQIRVETYDKEQDCVKMRFPGIWGIDPGGRIFFKNIVEEIDEPEEWCISRREKALFFLPPEGFGEKGNIEIAWSQPSFLRIAGSNVRVEGLVFRSKIGRPAVVVRAARDVSIAGCAFHSMGAIGVSAIQDNRRVSIQSCDFGQMGTTAVVLTGGCAQGLERGENVMENCHLWDIARVKYASDAVRLDGCGNSVRNCFIHRTAGIGLRYSGMEQTVEYCRIQGTAQETADSAAVYSGGERNGRGCVVRFNDIGSENGYKNGIYLDDCSSGHSVYGNIVRNAGFVGIFVGGGRNNIISNNMITASWGGLSWDARGWSWPNWKGKEKDIVAWWKKSYDVEHPPYSVRFPELAASMNDGDLLMGPVDNRIVNNLVVDISDAGVPVKLGALVHKRIPTDRRGLIAGNLYVRTCGSTTTNDANRLKFEIGWRQLDGTKDDPVDLGFVDLPKREIVDNRHVFRKGNLNLRAGARLVKELPGWQDLPFDRIGLYKDNWRKKIEE